MILLIIIAVFVVLAVVAGVVQGLSSAKTQPARDARIVCPHCHVTGMVRSRPRRVKKGISGGKATGAILTGGASLLATGLSKKEWTTLLTCSSCGMSWTV